MILTKTGNFLTIACPAKVNLFLELHGLRPDGYHEIETVMQAVTLYDQLVLRSRAEPGLTLCCSDRTLPGGPDNLVWRAAALLDSEVGLRRGVSMWLDKRIPHAAGLGGGSSDAAAALVGLNELLGLGLSRETLLTLGARIGSDVPFFLYGGTALCRGRGEQVTPLRAAFRAHYVIVCPDRGLSTAEVYRSTNGLGLTTGDRDASVIMTSLAHHEPGAVRRHLFNRLGAAAEVLAPEVARARGLLAEVAHEAACVSGSGSAVYVLLDSAADAAQVAAGARAAGLRRVFVAQSETPGADVVQGADCGLTPP